MNTLNNKNEKSGESGPPLIKPEGADCSEKRAAFATSSKTVSTKTVALPGLNVKAGTSAGTTAKPGSSKATTTAAPGAKPTNQRQKAKGDAKSLVAGAVPKEWPTLRVEEPSKAKYAERKRADGDPEGRIPRTQWKWVQAALANVALEVLLSNPGPPPSCTDAGWYQGQIKIVACDDERSVQLYKAALAKVGEVYPGAKLIAVDRKDIPSRPRARVWIPATPSQPDQIMQLIRACNPNLPTGGWKFVKAFDEATTESGVETKRATMQILLLLTNDAIEPLNRSGGEINYGFTKVKVKTYKADAGAIDHLTSDNEMGEVEEDPMESSSDVPCLEQVTWTQRQ
ncbi:uncharacterized protein LOC128921974 [Zeugodacus cucurbitae]|uniref:uncharacterized protein LOC128921974 n=1 Tax=Zeugodacus cucurbitae TaxID=28588 RepID=UPI0023D91E87|nr:uncharacterized protein LOC128921974 [Zeugodacus cucurbitae]